VSVKRLFLIATVIAIALYSVYAVFFSVDVVTKDIWDEVPLIGKYHDGSLSLMDFFGYQNEHRIAVHTSFAFLLNLISKYNMKWQVVSVIFLVFGCFWICMKALLHDFKFERSTLVFLLFPFLVFSMKPQTVVFLPDLCRVFVVLFAMASFYLIAKGSRLSIIAGFLSSFSIVSGLLIWPAGLIQILLLGNDSGSKKRKIVTAGIWSVSAVFCFLLYFVILPSDMPGGFHSYMFKHPVETLGFCLCYIGGALFYHTGQSIAAGALIAFAGIVSLIIVLRSANLRNKAWPGFWIALLLWGVASMLMIAYGRVSFGVHVGRTSRFVMTSMFVLIPILVLVQYSLRERSVLLIKGTRAVISSLCILGILISFAVSFPRAENLRQENLVNREILKNYMNESDERLLRLYPSPDALRSRADILRKYGYSVFRDK
jgi:hypothetical protein